MDQSKKKKKANQMRQKEKEEVQAVIPNWSDLCPDLLRCVCNRLSFTELSRAKSVCSSWHSCSRGCVPTPNQIPWLILFPPKEKGNSNNNDKSSCVLFVPDDKDNVYKTRDLDVDFVQSDCLATYGSWLLMLNPYRNNLYIFNPLTPERIDLPYTTRKLSILERSSFWIDNKTKDYLVVMMMEKSGVFTKKGVNKWHELTQFGWSNEILYNHKNQKLYIYYNNGRVNICDFSGDKPRKDGVLDCFTFNHYDTKNLFEIQRRFAVTISGDVLIVSYCWRMQDCKSLCFYIYKSNHVNRKWVEINSLGDEALILDMGVTVIAKDVQGFKRNSIYFSGLFYGRDDPKLIFVYDLTTQKMESLPQCVFSSIQFSDARWFFPDFNG